MIHQLADPGNYVFNGYAMPMLAAGAAIFCLGFFVLTRERGSGVGSSFFLICLSVSLYLTSAGISYVCKDAGVLLFWMKMSQLGVVFIPSSVLLLALALFGLSHRYSLVIAASFALSFLFALGDLLTDLHIRKAERFFWGNYPQYGILGFAFLMYFFSVMAFILFLYWREYQGSKTERNKKRIRGLLIAFSGGYLGAVDFIPALGISLYPFGYIPIFFFIFVCTYVVIRYQLVEITPETAAGEILDIMQGGVIVADLDGKVRVANSLSYEMLGHQAGSLLGRDMTSIAPIPNGLVEAVRTGQRARGYETVWPGRNGQYQVSLSASLLTDNRNGEPLGIVYVAHDITERKRVQEKLFDSRQMLQLVLDHIPQRIFWKDRASIYLGCNKALALDCGYADPSELIGKTDYETASAATADVYRADDRMVMETGLPKINYEEHQIKTDGSIGWLRTSKVPLRDQEGRVIGVLGMYEDFTERKRAEEALSISERQFRHLFEDSPVSLWEEDFSELQTYIAALRSAGITDLDSYFTDHPEEVFKCVGLVKVISINKATLKVYEATDPVTILQDLSRVFTAESFDAFRGIVVALSEGVEMYECETVGRTLKGRTIDVLLRWSLLSNGQISQSRALISIVDITERKQAEKKLRQNERFIRNILDTVDEGFIIVDRDYRILTANKAYCGQVGMPCDDVIGKNCYRMSHKTYRPCYEEGEECAVRQVFETGQPHAVLHKHTDYDGQALFVETKGFPIKDAAGNVTSVIETIINITEKHLLEEERLKTQKLESIGTLAGGIAHDFNNLLQGIFGYISMAKMNIDHKNKALAMLVQAENALQQSVNLTSQLLTFAKGGKPVKKLIDLRPVIENSTKFTLSGSRSDFRVEIPDSLWLAEADEGQVGQVIQNIVLNADQAMPLSGSVIVTAANMVEGDASLPPGLARGNYIRISIRDTGVGIPEQYIGKIFDPYFTTKEKGSGLGLATSYSIIRNHGGMIDIRTSSGEGSTFMIYVPAIVGDDRPATATTPTEPSPQRAVRVLVMDDEEVLRNLSNELLRALGHEVAVAEHGQEALEKYQEAMVSGKPFDIVILDLTIRGGMGGADTMQKLLEIDPAVKVIMSSGYSDDEAIADYLSHGFKAYLKKPYDIAVLRDILNSLTA